MNVFRHTAYFFHVRTLKIKLFPGFENFEIKIQIILLQYEIIECDLYHDENGYLCKSESWLLTCLKMVIRYDSAHRGLIYLLISLFSFFHFHYNHHYFICRKRNESSISISGAWSSSYKILRSVYTLNGVSHAGVTKPRADTEPIRRYSIRKSRAPMN